MNSRSMAGWIGFAGILMVILGGISVFEGLIALIRDNYYVVTPSGYLLFDVTGWGWIMLIWGIVLALVGLGLAIVKSITQAHDGTLTLDPRAAGGLRVTVQLPAAPPHNGR